MDTRRLWLSILTIIFVTLPTHRSDAALVISDIELTETTLSFALSGTVDVVGTFGGNQLYIGESSNTSWVASFSPGSWADNGGTYTFGDAIVNSTSAGDVAVLTGAATSLSVGDTIDGTFSASGTFDPNATNTDNWIVSAGYTTPSFVTLPDPGTATGQAVPEPSTGLIAMAMMVGLACRRRR